MMFRHAFLFTIRQKEFAMLKIRDVLKKVLLCFGAFSLIIVAVVLFGQTFARYFFHYSFFWADELSRYVMIWGAQLCAAVGVSEKTHTALDFLVSKFSARVHAAILALLDVVYIAFSSAMFYYSFANIRLGMKSVSPGLGLPMGYVYLALTVSMILTVFFLILNLVEDAKHIVQTKEV